MKYDVHLYAVVRVKMPGIEAESQIEAIRAAEKIPDLDRLFARDHPTPEIEYTAYAEEIVSYLVDQEGDEDYENSRAYNANMEPEPFKTEAELSEINRDLLAACQLCLQKVPYGAIWDTKGQNVQWVKLMRAAIKQATGKEPTCPDDTICPACGNVMKDNVCVMGCERR